MELIDKELEPLKNAVMAVLESDGTLDELRNQLRANVFRVCDYSYDKSKSGTKNDKQSDENQLINQLIVEYFDFNGFKHSSNVFKAESGQKDHSNIDRHQVESQLKFEPKEQAMSESPLLVTVIKYFLNRKTNSQSVSSD